LHNLSSLISSARSGALILTANERLFRHLRSCFDLAMQQSGAKIWGTPEIISYQGWLSRCLAELGDSWRLLNKNAALRLWEQLIEDSSRGTGLELLQVSKTAERAYEAYQLLQEYDVSLAGFYLTEDQQVFSRWHEQFKLTCQQQEWLDRSELPAYICAALKTGRLVPAQQILLVGFDQLPPGAERLTATCREIGISCEPASLSSEVAEKMLCYAAQDEDHEIEQAARWARRLLDEGAASVGVVVFDLQAKRRKIERIFRDQIDPAATPLLYDEEANFTLSLGGPLAEQGVVHAACEFLSVGRQLPLEEVSFLLLTPYLGGSQQELDSRAQLDARIRSFRQIQISLSGLESLAEQNDQLKQLQKICRVFDTATKDHQHRLPGAWAEQFAMQLRELGWPGDRTMASSEYQAIKVWREKLLPALASLDPVSKPISRGQALGWLRRLAADIDFQLESPTGPLQLVGQLESAGLHFDHLWVMGLSENVLPAAARPNPFLPYQLQKQQGMPHADAERELLFAEQVVERLQTAAPEVIFSYPTRDGDCELRPSPLLPEQAIATEVAVAERQDALSWLLQAPCKLQQREDLSGPPLTDGKGSGGTGILKDQAHCPFRAFVHHRLRGRELETASAGFDAMTRGDLVHLVLERLWQRLRDQQALLGLDEIGQTVLLETVVESSVDEYFSTRTLPSAQLLALEKERLVLLLGDWLDSVERNRDPFRVVEMEQEHIEQLGPLQIRTKIDRVDELADGSKVVIDYKTGRDLKTEDLLCEPLLEPQLPIYAVAQHGAEADGVAFAQVRRSESRLLGVVKEKGLLGRVKALADFPQATERNLDSWQALLDDWRRQLEKLASDFVAGQAEVRPYNIKRSCQYCDLPGLCRIGEVASSEGGDA